MGGGKGTLNGTMRQRFPECRFRTPPRPNHTVNKLSQRDSRLGRVPTSSTNSVGNLAVYEECLAIRRRLAKVDPYNA